MIQTYLKDIQKHVEAIPYGEVHVELKRVGKRTTQTTIESGETLRYTDTDSGILDIHEILSKLSEDGYSGSTSMECKYVDGKMVMITIKDKIQIQY